MLEVPDWGFASWSWSTYGNWFLVHPWSKFWISILILKVQRTSMYFKSSFGAGGSWLGFKSDFDLDMVTCLWYAQIQIFLSLSSFWRCKEHPSPLSPAFGLWLGLEVLDWDFASWFWFGYGHLSLIHLCPRFWPYVLIVKVQRIPMSSKSWLRSLEDTGSSWLRFGMLILIWIWSMVIETSIPGRG